MSLNNQRQSVRRDYGRITVYVPPEVRETIEQMAGAQGISISRLLAPLLEKFHDKKGLL